MRFTPEQRWLNLPVRDGAPKVALQLRTGDRMVREFEIELAETPEAAAWWAFYDLGAFRHCEIELVPSAPASALPLEGLVRLGDEPAGLAGLYHESARPQLHFTSRRGWNNDPNGLVYHRGRWHLFFQHNPFGVHWGNMHWGHAVSPDLVHWTELPTALYPRSLKDMAYSGGGFVDHGNSAGFGRGAEDVLMVAFTSTGRGECLAWSPDGGDTLVEYEGNPVLRHRGRDPRVLWHAPTRRWVMVVYDETDSHWRYAFYTSSDLRTWLYASAIPGFYECPDLFELAVDGDPAQRRWVLHGAERRDVDGRRQLARSSFQVGTFDGRTFTPETPVTQGHLGPHFYAAQTFANAPGGRVIMLGWLSGARYPGMPFSQGLTVPLEVTLRRTPSGLRLAFTPVAELAALRRAVRRLEAPSLSQANAALAASREELLDLTLELSLQRESVLHLDLRGLAVVCDVAAGTLTAAGVTAPLPLHDRRLALRVLLDRGVIELFAGGGLVALSHGAGPAPAEAPLRLDLRGPGRVESIEIAAMDSMWPHAITP